MLLALLQFFSAQFLYLALHLESGSFPRPLTPKEEAAAFEALRAGDSAAREKIIQHNLRLVAHIAKKYYALPSDQDDLISIGTIGLIKAVNTFDSTRRARFSTYASRCIENATLSPRPCQGPFGGPGWKSGPDFQASAGVELLWTNCAPYLPFEPRWDLICTSLPPLLPPVSGLPVIGSTKTPSPWRQLCTSSHRPRTAAVAPPSFWPAAEGSSCPGGHPPSPLHRHGDRRLHPLPCHRHGQAGGALSGTSRGAAGRV